MTESKNLPISLIGSGALGEGVKELKKHGFKKVFIVVSETLSKRDGFAKLKKELEKSEIDCLFQSREARALGDLGSCCLCSDSFLHLLPVFDFVASYEYFACIFVFIYIV